MTKPRDNATFRDPVDELVKETWGSGYRDREKTR